MMEHLLGIRGSTIPSNLDDTSTSKIQENVPKMNTADYLVAFSGLSKSYCVGLVDMVIPLKFLQR